MGAQAVPQQISRNILHLSALFRTHWVNPLTRKVLTMNAANNLALAQRGTAVVNHRANPNSIQSSSTVLKG